MVSRVEAERDLTHAELPCDVQAGLELALQDLP